MEGSGFTTGYFVGRSGYSNGILARFYFSIFSSLFFFSNTDKTDGRVWWCNKDKRSVGAWLMRSSRSSYRDAAQGSAPFGAAPAVNCDLLPDSNSTSNCSLVTHTHVDNHVFLTKRC